ncbi:MAG: hypothetical protein LC721_08130 [Actinobacteria bacterium]|nr:hypothetical protein [Actinomycetota bacterium]
MVGLGDAEDRDEPVGCGDGHLCDEGFDQCLGLVVGAAGDDLGDVVGNLGQGGGFRCGGLVVEGAGEFVAVGAELGGFGAQLAEPVGDEVLVHGAAFECGQVAVDGLAGFGQISFYGGEFGVPVGVGGLVLGLCGGDGVCD